MKNTIAKLEVYEEMLLKEIEALREKINAQMWSEWAFDDMLNYNKFTYKIQTIQTLIRQANISEEAFVKTLKIIKEDCLYRTHFWNSTNPNSLQIQLARFQADTEILKDFRYEFDF